MFKLRHLRYAAAGLALLSAAFAAPASAQDIDPSKTFTFGHSFSIPSLDPAKAKSASYNAFLYPVFDRLIYQDPEGKYQPMLAESWSFNDDNTVLTLKLRQGVVFHDGSPLDAAAAKANLDRMLTHPESTMAKRIAVIDTVEAKGAATLEIKLKGGAGGLLAELADIPGMIMSPASFDKPDMDRQPVGSGPYKVKSVNGSDSIEYQKFDEYWDPSVQKTAAVKIVGLTDDNTRLNALQTGAVDAALGREHLVDRMKASGAELLSEPWGSAAYQFVVNTSVAPFDNIDVRRGLNFAIDRDGISNGLLKGQCTPSVQPFSDSSWANDKTIKPAEVYPHDVAKAKELLEKGGVKDGFSFQASVVNISGFMAVAQAVQAQLAEVGVNMEIVALDAASYRTAFTSGQTQALLTTSIPAMDPSAYIVPDYLENSVNNPGKLKMAGVEAAYQDAIRETDQGKREAAFHVISQEILKEVPGVMMICMRPLIIGVNSKVVGLKIYSAGQLDFRNVGVAQ